MPPTPPADDTQIIYDETDADQDVLITEVEDEVVDPVEVEAPVHTELDPEIEEEIKRALVPDEIDDSDSTPKAKNHQIPQHLIDKELEPDDLIDEGSI